MRGLHRLFSTPFIHTSGGAKTNCRHFADQYVEHGARTLSPSLLMYINRFILSRLVHYVAGFDIDEARSVSPFALQ